MTLAARIDHTLLRPDCTEAQIIQLCEEAAAHGFATVCVPPCYVALAAGKLEGTAVGICTVIGFPLGYATSAAWIMGAMLVGFTVFQLRLMRNLRFSAARG